MNYYNQTPVPGNPLFVGNNQNQTNLPINQSIGSQQMPLPAEQSYIENILRLNKGKQVRVHMTFPDSNQWRDMEFKGIIEQSGRDHIILSEPASGIWEVLLMIYVDWISFDEAINYSTEFYPTN